MAGKRVEEEVKVTTPKTRTSPPQMVTESEWMYLDPFLPHPTNITKALGINVRLQQLVYRSTRLPIDDRLEVSLIRKERRSARAYAKVAANLVAGMTAGEVREDAVQMLRDVGAGTGEAFEKLCKQAKEDAKEYRILLDEMYEEKSMAAIHDWMASMSADLAMPISFEEFEQRKQE